MARATVDVCLQVLKERNKSRFDSYSSGTVYGSYPIIPFRIIAYTVFPTTFLEIAVYLCLPARTTTQNDQIWERERQCHKLFDIHLSEFRRGPLISGPVWFPNFQTTEWKVNMWWSRKRLKAREVSFSAAFSLALPLSYLSGTSLFVCPIRASTENQISHSEIRASKCWLAEGLGKRRRKCCN